MSSFVRLLLAAIALSIGGCAALSGRDEADGLNLPDPSPALLKKVERDPFPRAGTPTGAAS